MTQREYWIMTEVFVYLHKGHDFCVGPVDQCSHCTFIAKTFDAPLYDDERGSGNTDRPITGRPVYDNIPKNT